jgi:hypothetical protein
MIDLMIGRKYFDSEPAIFSLFGSVPSLAKLDLPIGLTTPLLLALQPLSHLTALYITLPFSSQDDDDDDDDDDDTIGGALIHVTSSLPGLVELEVNLRNRGFPSRFVSVAASISSGHGDENHIDHKDWIWSMTQLKHLSIERCLGALPAMHAPQLTYLYIGDWSPRNGDDDDEAHEGKSQSPPVDQIWRACPSLLEITIVASDEEKHKNAMSRVIKPPWRHYTSHSKISMAIMDSMSWFANDVADIGRSWLQLEHLTLYVRHSTPATIIEVILNGCRKLESFTIRWYADIGTIDDDLTTSDARYVDAIGIGKHSHQYLTHLGTTRYSASLLQDWSFPSLTSLDFDPSKHNNVDDLETHMLPFMTRLPRLYRLSFQIDFEEATSTTIDDDSKRSNNNKPISLKLAASDPSLSSAEGGADSHAPFVLESLRTLTLGNATADFYEPILRAATIELQTIKWSSIIDSASLNRFILVFAISPMKQLSTLYFTEISFDDEKDSTIWQLLFETLPHLMTLILPEAMVPKVRAVAKMMTPIPRVSIEPIDKDRAFDDLEV